MRIFKSARGATGLQYTLVVGLIAVFAIGAIGLLGHSQDRLMVSVSETMNGQLRNYGGGGGATAAPPASLAWTGNGSSMSVTGPGSTTGNTVTFTLTNNGQQASGDLTGAIALAGTNPQNFTIMANGCSGPLGPGASCAVQVRPTASVNGAYSASLRANTDNAPAIALSGAASGFLANLAWTGTGTGMDVAGPSTTGAPVTFTLTNSGGGTSISLTGTITLGGANPANFTLGTNTCSGTLAPAASCTVTVTPTATLNGSYGATLATSAHNAPTVSLAGTAAGFPAVLAWSGSGTGLSIGSSGTGTPTVMTLTNNGGGASVSLSGTIAITGTNPANFSLSGNTCTGVLAPGASCTVQITPSAIDNGAFSATLGSTANNAPTTPLSATAGGLVAALAWSGSGSGMNVVGPSTSGALKSFTLTNTGAATSASLAGAIALTGSNPSYFTLGINTCTGPLAPSATCSVQVTPVSSGNASYTALLSASVNNAPTLALSGAASGFGCSAQTVNGYTVSTLANGASISVSKSLPVTNGQQNFTATATCSSDTVTITAESSLIACSGGFTLASGSCLANCGAGTLDGYSFTALNHGASQTVTKQIAITGGQQNWQATASCATGTTTVNGSSAQSATCTAAYIQSGTSCLERCAVDTYWNGSSCVTVGIGNYSPANNNNTFACTNKPANSAYTTTGGGANNCGWSCNAGYNQSGSSCIVGSCPALTANLMCGGSAANTATTTGIAGCQAWCNGQAGTRCCTFWHSGDPNASGTCMRYTTTTIASQGCGTSSGATFCYNSAVCN